MKKVFNKKNLLFLITTVCLVGLIGIGMSYAYYLANFSVSNPENANNNLTTTSTTDVVMDMQGKYVPSNTVPGFKGVKEVVVRGLGEKNSVPSEASIQITPDFADFGNDVTWKLYKSDTPITCTSNVNEGIQYYDEANCDIPKSATLELEGGSESDYLNITVNPLTETKYYLVVEYANNGDQSSQMGKSFSVTIGLGSKVENPIDDIIAQLDTTGKCPTINSDGTVNATKEEASDGYLCKAKDAYGDSYYYRGNVINNYVKFADKYWRIVRINGDGTVRVIYDGTSAHTNGESSNDRQIGTSEFNLYWKKDNVQETTNSRVNGDNAGVGYMYGNRDAIVEATSYDFRDYYTNTSTYYIAKEYIYDATTDRFTLKDPIAVLGSAMTSDYIGYYTFNSTSANNSSSYVYKIFNVTADRLSASVKYGYVRYGTSSKEVAQTNTNDSTIKTYLDNWYKANISSTENEQYLADNIFCNDRSFSSSNSGTGAGISFTMYNWGSWHFSKSNLRCPQQNDAFTVSDTTNGNGALTYPIGLITIDEAILAGGSSNNNGYYLYSGQAWWASSPATSSGSSARTLGVGIAGNAGSNFGVDYSRGVRPVLNLKAEVLAQGSGTASDPYRIS